MATPPPPASADLQLPRAVFLDAISLGPVDLAPIEQWCDDGLAFTTNDARLDGCVKLVVSPTRSSGWGAFDSWLA